MTTAELEARVLKLEKQVRWQAWVVYTLGFLIALAIVVEANRNLGHWYGLSQRLSRLEAGGGLYSR